MLLTKCRNRFTLMLPLPQALSLDFKWMEVNLR